jgi:hypothetical protein
MPRLIEVRLAKRGVTCVAQLLDDLAPHTCAAIWDGLPLGGDAYHAKYARNEIYTLVAPFATREPPLENPTITPIPGDLVYFHFAPWQLSPASHGYAPEPGTPEDSAAIDLAVFYGRNNLLLNPDFGFVPGTVYGAIVEGLDALAAAANDMWRSGVIGEQLSFHPLDRTSV